MDQSTFVPARPADVSPLRCSQPRKFHGDFRRLDGVKAVTDSDGEPDSSGAPGVLARPRCFQSYCSLIRVSPPRPEPYRELVPSLAQSRRVAVCASGANRAAGRQRWVPRPELPAFLPATPPVAD